MLFLHSAAIPQSLNFRSTCQVPLLNSLDCWISYCILILVAGSALYLNPVYDGAMGGGDATPSRFTRGPGFGV